MHDDGHEPDEARRELEERLDRTRDALATAGLTLRCERGDDGAWRLVLEPPGPIPVPDGVAVRVWPITLAPDDRARAADPLRAGEALEFAAPDVAHLTTFIAFEAAATGADARVRFVLTLPVEGLPAADRDASIAFSVILDRQGFVRYLLMLLAADDEDLGGTGVFRFGNGDRPWPESGGFEDLPLLEEMTRAYCRDLAWLRSVRRLVRDLARSEAHDDVVPKEFWDVWNAFEAALGAGKGTAPPAGPAPGRARHDRGARPRPRARRPQGLPAPDRGLRLPAHVPGRPAVSACASSPVSVSRYRGSIDLL